MAALVGGGARVSPDSPGGANDRRSSGDAVRGQASHRRGAGLSGDAVAGMRGVPAFDGVPGQTRDIDAGKSLDFPNSGR